MIIQLAIAFTGLIAIWLSQSGDENQRRYACLFGLAGQPFWVAASLSAEQWGILVLTLFYTVSWARGVKNNWLRKRAAA